jgi:host factor-I protein
MKSEKKTQESFISYLVENKTPVTVFLLYGVKLQGIITDFDADSLLLRREGHTQLVYKHAVSTIMPTGSVHVVED